MWDRVRHWHSGLEPEAAVLVALQHTSSIWPVATGVLDIVVPRRIRLPNVDLAILDRTTASVLERTNHEQRLSVAVMGHERTIVQELGFVRVERAENGPFGASRRLGVINRIDQE